MAPRYQQGYKPLQTREVAALDPLSTRFAQHMEDNVNSTVVALSPKLVAQAYPGGYDVSWGTLGAAGGMLGVWGPFKISHFYDKLSWASSFAGASANLRYYVFCGDTMPVFNISGAGSSVYGNYDSDENVQPSATAEVVVRKRSLEIRRNMMTGESWIWVVVGTNVAMTSGAIYNLDITAEHSPAY